MFDAQLSVGVLLFIMVLLTLKHYVADYQFQPQVLADAKCGHESWKWAITIHSVVHGLLTALVLAPLLGWTALLLGLVDTCLHFFIDYWKSRKATQYTPAQRKFWLMLGIDQTLHHLTYIALAYLAVRFAG